MGKSEKIKAEVPYNDLREWMHAAEKLGELRVAKGYDWQEQIGMAASYSLIQGFDESSGYRKQMSKLI
jgi:hypothetical protein